MSDPQFASPLDDALDDFRLAAEQLPKVGRIHLLEGLSKLTEHVRGIESRLAEIEQRDAHADTSEGVRG